MMSAAISMIVGLEQTKVQPLSNDLPSVQGGLEDLSFAKNFNERVGLHPSSQGKNIADDLAVALPDLKGTTVTKNLEEVAQKSSGVKENPVAPQEVAVHGELTGIGAGNTVPPQAATATGVQETIAASGSWTTKVDVPAQVEGTAADVSSASSIPPASPVPGATEESPVPQVSSAEGDQAFAPPVLSDSTPLVQRGAQSSEKVIEGVSSKKPVKAQESSGTPKTVQKTAGKMVNATAVHSKPVTGISTESAIPVVGQAAAATVVPPVVPQGEISQTDVSSKVASPATQPAAGISPVAIEAPARKDIASAAKTTSTDSAMTVTAGNDPIASPKPDIGADKAPALTIAGGSDGQNKPQVVREPAAALVHSPSIAPAAVVSGNTPGELITTKLPAGDAGAYAGGVTAGSREQDGSGVVAPSMDGAPRMLTATPTSLEVGIQNGTHGWLKVRAEMTDGVVNASVSAASSAGQEMLHRELPGLTAYLQQEKVAVNAVIVHAPSAAGVDARSSSGTDGAGGQTSQRSNQEEPQHQSLRKTTLNGSDETASYRGLHGVDDDGSLPLAAYVNGGSWLSVRA